MTSRKITFFSFKDYEECYYRDAIDAYDPPERIDYEFVTDELCMESIEKAVGSIGVCIFVHDDTNEAIVRRLYEIGVRIILCRCAGYN
jgi:D-lactate dehydrogenase